VEQTAATKHPASQLPRAPAWKRAKSVMTRGPFLWSQRTIEIYYGVRATFFVSEGKNYRKKQRKASENNFYYGVRANCRMASEKGNCRERWNARGI
jgi:hypothetical protein